MPRRNSNALIPRTLNRSSLPIKALRTSTGITYVQALSKPSADGRTLVLLGGIPIYVQSKSLINI